MIEPGTQVQVKSVDDYEREQGVVVPDVLPPEYMYPGEVTVLLAGYAGAIIFPESELEVIE